ncbi:MAG: PilZ domain-containing protein [Candidatus Omnitrophota bacterium]
MIIGTEDDRRIFARFAVENVPADITVPGAQRPERAECYDLSASGVGVVVDAQLVPLTTVGLELHLPKVRSVFKSFANVVWSKQIHEGKWRAGLEFTTLDFMGLTKIFAQAFPRV